MDRRAIRSIGRMMVYVAVAALAYAGLWLVRLLQGGVDGPDATVRVLVGMTLALVVGVPGALMGVMAKES